MIAKAPGDRESAGLPHSAGMIRKLGGAPVAGPQKVTAKGPMLGAYLSARELQSGMISNHAEVKLGASRELPKHGPFAPAGLNCHDSEVRVEVHGGEKAHD